MKSSATFNPVLTTMFNQYFVDPMGFVGLLLAPLFRTAEVSSTYPVFDKGNLLNIPLLKQRAPGTPFQMSVPAISDDQYGCKNYGHSVPVPDETRKKYARQIDADRAAVRRNAHVILFNHERRVHALYTGNGVATSSPAAKWDDFGNAASDPVGDVAAVLSLVDVASGMRPNLMTVSQQVYDKLVLHPKIRAIYPQYNGTITKDMLRAAFNIPRLEIAGSKENTANEGQAMSIAYLWGDDVILTHVEPGQDLESPCAARTFLWETAGESGGGEAGSYIESYRNDDIKSDIHRSLHHTDEKLTGASFAYRLNNVLT